jgi:predicted transcriptional regulator
MPKLLASGNYPAIEAVRVGIARDLIRMRRSVGISQAELARRAGIRVETVNRLEKAKQTPNEATINKIVKVLKSAGAKE